jgi:hypothetical protein
MSFALNRWLGSDADWAAFRASRPRVLEQFVEVFSGGVREQVAVHAQAVAEERLAVPAGTG